MKPINPTPWQKTPGTAVHGAGCFLCIQVLNRKRFPQSLQSEVTLCVVEADTLDDLLQSLLVIGILAVLDPLADQVAQDAAEVVVAGVAQEAA